MLQDTKLKMLTVHEIQPTGWLKRQLEIQAAGLSGNLDKIWPDVRDSKWIGGTSEGWERVPYWLDGFIPLAWLLDDPDLKARAKRYVDAILARQQEDGWLCPCTMEERPTYDMWALFLLGKVLVLYQECSGDERIEEALYRAFQNYRAHLDRHTVFGWASCRWYEALIPIYWLYERRPEPWLLDLAKLLHAQGMDYRKLYETLPMERMGKRHWSFTDHVVNTAMALKSEALYARISGGDPGELAEEMLSVLMKKHGMAAAHFTGDECLCGDSPIQGSELCGVVEAMYSYEHLLAATGNPVWADRLEALAFNALPATISPDMWTHQYDQMTNQPECRLIPPEEVHFISNGGESHLFGLEPNFGCCTANFNQGWPKFTLSLFMRSADGLAITALAPGKVRLPINGVPVEVEVETEYPFRDTARITVTAEQPVEFSLQVRIPGCARKAELDGKNVQAGSFETIRRRWEGAASLDLRMAFEPEFVSRPRGMSALWRGPLLYSLAIQERWVKKEYEKDGVERKYPYCDYEIYPESKWNYAFCSDSLRVEEFPVGDFPFSPQQAPVRIHTMMCEIPWSANEWGICAETPDRLEPVSDPQEKLLIPYGCTNLRMTEMPKLK